MKNLDAILDDRLAIVGTSGSGKTYAAKTGAERLLDIGHRLCVVDPLGVWFGLRSNAAGDGPGYPVVVFGGRHADVPMTEHYGAALSEFIAGSDISSIIDLSELPSQGARRRFMRDFAESLYAKNRQPLHLILDEADLWAPQKPIEPAAQILGSRIDEIVRRGRIRGFTPWLITQRPAVIHKDVLSQLDVLIAMKLTSSQDRNALDSWIDGQADKADQKRIIAGLPKLQVGHGIIWAPGHGILTEYHFPRIRTFDSSRTPKRGEKVKGPTSRAQIDLGAIRALLATVETEVAENDPTALRRRIAELEKQLKVGAAPSQSDLDMYFKAGKREGQAEVVKAIMDDASRLRSLSSDLSAVAKRIDDVITYISNGGGVYDRPPSGSIADVAQPVEHRPSKPSVAGSTPVVRSIPQVRTEGINGPQQRILDALAWWASAGITEPSRIQVAVIARYSPSGGAFQNPLGSLRTMGLVEYPSSGSVALTAAGRAAANDPGEPATAAELHARLQGILNGPQWRILAPIIKAYPRAVSRASVAAAAGYEATGGAFQNPLGSLRSLGLIEYPAPGVVVALPVLFVERQQ